MSVALLIIPAHACLDVKKAVAIGVDTVQVKISDFVIDRVVTAGAAVDIAAQIGTGGIAGRTSAACARGTGA